MVGTALAIQGLTLLVGLGIQWSKGLPARFSPQVRSVAERGEAPWMHYEVSLEEARSGRFHELGQGPLRLWLWGDSQAMSLIPELERLAQEHRCKIVVATHTGAPPLLNYPAPSTCTLKDELSHWNQAVADHVARQRPPTVLLVARWNYQLKPGWQESLGQTVSAVTGSGSRCALMLETPVYGFDPRKALARALLWGRYMIPLSYPGRDFVARRAASPLFPDLAAVRARSRPGSLAGFLSLYRDVCRLLRGPDDFALLARDLTARLRRGRIVYAEVYVSPAVVERVGFPWPAVRDAVEPVFAAHERAGHGRIRVLLDAVRHFGPDAAHRVLDLHASHPWPRAVGFGLGGDELAVPARDFVSVYRRLPRLGLAPVVHAGETGGADSVGEALRWLKPRRIAHGVGAAADPALVRRLTLSGVALDVCLTSNAATGAHPLAGHPVLRLLRSGVAVTLATDDPGLFGTTLLGEYRLLARLGATERELASVLRAGFRAALAPAGRHQLPASATTLS